MHFVSVSKKKARAIASLILLGRRLYHVFYCLTQLRPIIEVIYKNEPTNSAEYYIIILILINSGRKIGARVQSTCALTYYIDDTGFPDHIDYRDIE